MVIATSTRCTAVFPSLGLRLPAGVPTPITEAQAAEIKPFPGIELVADPEPPTSYSPEEV